MALVLMADEERHLTEVIQATVRTYQALYMASPYPLDHFEKERGLFIVGNDKEETRQYSTKAEHALHAWVYAQKGIQLDAEDLGHDLLTDEFFIVSGRDPMLINVYTEENTQYRKCPPGLHGESGFLVRPVIATFYVRPRTRFPQSLKELLDQYHFERVQVREK